MAIGAILVGAGAILAGAGAAIGVLPGAGAGAIPDMAGAIPDMAGAIMEDPFMHPITVPEEDFTIAVYHLIPFAEDLILTQAGEDLIKHQEMEEQLPVRGPALQDQGRPGLLRREEVPAHTDQEQRQEEWLALMPLQETEHTEQAGAQDLYRDILAAVLATVILTGDILLETAHIAGAQQQIDRAQQEGLMEVQRNVVRDIPGPLHQCQEHQDIVPEEVRDQEAQVIEVREVVRDQEVRAIEVQDQEVQGPEVRAIEVPVVAPEVPEEA